MFVARAFGLDIFAAGYGSASIGGILLCGLGGGAGLQLARWARNKVNKDKGNDKFFALYLQDKCRLCAGTK